MRQLSHHKTSTRLERSVPGLRLRLRRVVICSPPTRGRTGALDPTSGLMSHTFLSPRLVLGPASRTCAQHGSLARTAACRAVQGKLRRLCTPRIPSRGNAPVFAQWPAYISDEPGCRCFCVSFEATVIPPKNLAYPAAWMDHGARCPCPSCSPWKHETTFG